MAIRFGLFDGGIVLSMAASVKGIIDWHIGLPNSPSCNVQLLKAQRKKHRSIQTRR
jgi:hypothetical protein